MVDGFDLFNYFVTLVSLGFFFAYMHTQVWYPSEETLEGAMSRYIIGLPLAFFLLSFHFFTGLSLFSSGSKKRITTFSLLTIVLPSLLGLGANLAVIICVFEY